MGREGLGPTKPVREGNRLYGRGGADDGYAPFCSMYMVKLMQELGLPHPRFVFFFETDEESGSTWILDWLSDLKDQVKTPNLIVCLDSGTFSYENWEITQALRGGCKFTLEAKFLKNGVHSGVGSGVVPDTFRLLRIALE